MNHKQKLLLFEILLILIVIIFFLFILRSNSIKQNNKAQANNSQIANPASVNCVNNGGTLKIMDGANGEYGVCYFKDGSYCEEWAYYRKECVPGQNK